MSDNITYILMPKSPKISADLRKNHHGEVAISLSGKIIAIGKNSLVAFRKAKKIIPDLENKEFVVTHIHHKYLAV